MVYKKGILKGPPFETETSIGLVIYPDALDHFDLERNGVGTRQQLPQAAMLRRRVFTLLNILLYFRLSHVLLFLNCSKWGLFTAFTKACNLGRRAPAPISGVKDSSTILGNWTQLESPRECKPTARANFQEAVGVAVLWGSRLEVLAPLLDQLWGVGVATYSRDRPPVLLLSPSSTSSTPISGFLLPPSAFASKLE
ncbi:hypothetical protein IQ07DRAFT_30432 [Pyrenochaeta sp. DS3sAY3a]|nr:hypothetical protein IQ07DRAFT_30432 [Pyrenochaeta sp. DS3sAY3a]